VFIFVLIGFFNLGFAPAGVGYGYAYSIVNISDINMINGVPVNNVPQENLINLVNQSSLNSIQTDDENYVGIKGFTKDGRVALYDDAPAINSGLKGILVKVNGVETPNGEKLREIFFKYSSGENIKITTKMGDELIEYDVVLGEHPEIDGAPYLGIISPYSQNVFLIEFNHYFSSIQKQNLYLKNGTFYEPRWPGLSEFIYYLFWWIVLINLLVALFNMLPLGALDGGRFFELTIFGLTKSENIAKKSSKWATNILLFVLLILMIRWVASFIW
jgi:hypothetical protein